MFKLNYTGQLEKKPITQVFQETLTNMIQTDPKVVHLDADLMLHTGVLDVQKKHPERVINCGIQEANMIGVAAGMSAVGLKPFTHSFAAFTSRRVFDQLFLSIGYAKKSAHIIATDAGIRQSFNGGTHMVFEDIAMMRTIPNAYVFDITDSVMFTSLIRDTKDLEGLYYFRTSAQQCDITAVYEEGSDFTIGKGNVLREGKDATIIACGLLVSVALEAAKLLESKGISVRVVDMFTIKPIDEELVIDCAKKTGAIVTAENHTVYGGLGSAVSEVLSEQYPAPLLRVGVKDEFGEVGPYDYLKERFGFTPQNLAANVQKAIALKSK